MGGGGSLHPLKNYGGFCEIPLNASGNTTVHVIQNDIDRII